MPRDKIPRPTGLLAPDRSMGERLGRPFTRPDNSMADAIYNPRGIQPESTYGYNEHKRHKEPKMDFIELATKMKHVDNSLVLALDPGHTTGYAVFQDMKLLDRGQIITDSIEEAVSNLGKLMELWDEEVVVVEDYRIYKWRQKQHVGSDLLTVRVIGCIETLCIQQGQFNIIKQPAHTAKTFCTDQKLKDWGFYQKAQKHANDAIRHGAYYLLFGAIERKQRQGATVG